MATKFAAGRDYGFWLDDNGELQVFGEFWTYNLPSSGGAAPLDNKMVMALEEPEVGGIRPEAGGFMLGDDGRLIGIGHYDLDYWAAFPPDAQSPTPPPVMELPAGTTGLLDLAGSSQMGAWVLDGTGAPQLAYISLISPRYAAIKAGTFTFPKPTGAGYTAIAVGLDCVYLLDSIGHIDTFGFVAPTILPSQLGETWVKVVASPTHAGALSDVGRAYWWTESSPATTTAIQTPPTDTIYADIGMGRDFSYLLVKPTEPLVGGQVRGYGTPLSTTPGNYNLLAPAGHDGVSQGPPIGVWGFAVLTETTDRPFGITPFGLNPPDIPPADEGPNPPIAFRVIDYIYREENTATPEVEARNQVILRWEPALDGLPAEFYEIARTPVVPGAPPISPPPGAQTKFVRAVGIGSQSTIFNIEPITTHEDSYYMIRSIGAGGIAAGGVSSWVTIKFDNTLLPDTWRKIFISLIDTDCDRGGNIIMLQIDEVVPGEDGWTGAEVNYENVPPGIYYGEAGTLISVARQTGRNVGTQTSAMDDLNGMTEIPIPASPEGFVSAIVDYEINIERPYTYWIYETPGSMTTGQPNGIQVAPLLATCRSQLPSPPHYLRCLTTHVGHVTSEFCLGHLDQLEYEIRSGVFSVLGRPAPVVVVDTRSTASGQLIFLSSGPEPEARAQLHTLREMFRMGHPMMLQTEDHYELAEGELYFQPTSITDRWVGDDARRPEHALEVQFIEIDPPRGRVVLTNIGLPLSTPVGSVLENPLDPSLYIEWAGHKNPLFGMKYCDGGQLEQFPTCDQVWYKDLASGTTRTCNELFHTPDQTSC